MKDSDAMRGEMPDDGVTEERPLVTIVTPSLNHARFVRETIDSVLTQDYPNVEYIVMDGGSTDGTQKILESYGDALTWVSEHDRGPADAINKGWRRARGRVLHWINSDDLLLPGAVSAAVNALAANRHAVGVYGPGVIVDVNGSFVDKWPVAEFNPREALTIHNPLLQPAVFLRREAADEAGPLDPSLHWAFDWDLFFRVLRLGDLVYVDRELAAWRKHDDTLSATGGLPRLREIFGLLRRSRVPVTAPAYRLHILWTVSSALENNETRVPAPLRGTASALDNAVSNAIRRLLWKRFLADGRYEDGWAPPRMRWRPQDTGSTLHISGTVDTQLFPWLRGQSLQVVVDGTVLPERFHLGDGPFDLSVDLPAPVDRSSVIEIRAAKSFVPARARLNDDRRRIAYVLSALSVT